ncbi:MAG: hypothetical protein NTW19_18085 [Planctomycetota bacterium]|nr:hypothetical protein [Planctomycetota bacterium]
MEIDFDGSFPADEKTDLKRAARDVVRVVKDLIPGLPPMGDRGFRIYRDSASPRVLWPSPAQNQYVIGLNLGSGRRYFQLAYQLGHELGHVMMDPSRTNGAIETLATALSLQVLLNMRERWIATPPHPHWRENASSFKDYYEETDKTMLSSLSRDIQTAVHHGRWDMVSAELRRCRGQLNQQPCDRPLNHLGARYLLSQKMPWKQLNGIASKAGPLSTDPSMFLKMFNSEWTRFPIGCYRFGALIYDGAGQ